MPLSKIVAKSITDDTITTDQIADNSVHGRRNVVINGAMRVHQRGNQTSTSGSSVYFVDRWNLYQNTGALGANLQQSTVVPSGQGFGNSLLIDCTTVDSSVAAGDIAVLRQVIEGQDLQSLAYGTSNAKSLTLSFWVRSTKTGTYGLEIYHNDTQSRHQCHPYTISQADTWEHKSITFSGDTSATIDNDNQATFYVQWALLAGTNFTSGTQQTTWANYTAANRFAGQVNFFDSTSNNFYLTGVQLEIGDKVTPFEHRSYGEELALCHRYFEKIYLNSYSCQLSAENSQQAKGGVIRFSEKRANPSITFPTIGTGSNQLAYTNSVGSYVTQGSTFRSTQTKTQMSIFNNYADGFSGMTAGDNVMLYVNGNVEIDVKAEL